MNIELLNKIIEHIEEEPRRFNMETWYTDASDIVKGTADIYDISEGEMLFGEDEDGYENVPPCGAVGCLAGTACILSGRVKPIGEPVVIEGRTVVSYEEPINGKGWFEEGRDALGLTDEQAQRLFFPRKGYGRQEGFEEAQAKELYWPEPFASEYYDARNDPQERAAIVKRRIAHFIATEGRE